MASFNEIPKRNPFRVPENYFEEVNIKMLSAAGEVNRRAKKVSFVHRFRVQLAVAASVALLALISYSGFRLITHGKSDSIVSEIISSELNESVINDIDILTLEDNMSSADLPVELSGSGRKEIIDYLLLENIEISEIYEKL